MIFRTSFLVVASVAVFMITRSKINCPMTPKTPTRNFLERNESTSFKQEQEEEVVVQGLESKAIDEVERNESEENEWISEFQLHNKDWNCVIEIEKLKNVAEKMEKRRKSLEMKLLELYCLKQQQLNIARLRKDLKLKIVEIDMLNATINSLQTEKIRLGEEIKQNELAEKQLENGRRRLVEMQNKKCVESAQMMMVKEQISGFKMEEKDDIMDAKLEKKIRAMKNVELERVELKRGNKELQLEMRELTVKLFATQTRITALSNMTECKIIGKAKDEIRSLTRSNDVLLEQVEKLQKNRFSMVEEVVYQRWLNACLRSEINNVYNTPRKQQLNPKFSNKLSFESQESANTSSSVESDETCNTTITSYSSSSQESIKKKRTLVQNIKKWGRRKDDDSIQKGLIRRYSMSNVPSDHTSTRSKQPYNEQFTSTFNSPSGLKQKDQVFGFSESPKTQRLRRVSFTDTTKSMDMDEKSDNEQISNITFYNSASELEVEKQKVTLSGGLRKTDNGNDEIENQVINKKGAVDSLSERKVSECDQLMDFVAAALVFFFFILLIYLFLASIIH